MLPVGCSVAVLDSGYYNQNVSFVFLMYRITIQSWTERIYHRDYEGSAVLYLVTWRRSMNSMIDTSCKNSNDANLLLYKSVIVSSNM